MKRIGLILALFVFLAACAQTTNQTKKEVMTATKKAYTGDPMVGFPPTAESQVTLGNYRLRPYNKWAFRNVAAVTNVVMVPRSGEGAVLLENYQDNIGQIKVTDAFGEEKTVGQLFEEYYTDGLLVVKNNTILFEKYYNGLTKDFQHIWFSATKSLTGTAFGILVDQGFVNLDDPMVKYIHELKGSGFERVSIQNVLNPSASIDFKENYTDPEGDWLKLYTPAMNMAQVPGGKDVKPGETEIYGIYDFLAKFIKPLKEETPGRVRL
jgi:hypothetical protein